MRITVYGSSSPRTPAIYLAAATQLGRHIAQRGWTLVNGAGKDGCMGALTDACLAAGGQVQGVILRQFFDQGLQHPALTGVTVADDMRTRKRLLAEDSHAFIALPGGPGTWEELWEIAVQRQIGGITGPLVIVNVADCYTHFRHMLERAEADGLLYEPAHHLMEWVTDSDAAATVVERFYAPNNRQHK